MTKLGLRWLIVYHKQFWNWLIISPSNSEKKIVFWFFGPYVPIHILSNLTVYFLTVSKLQLTFHHRNWQEAEEYCSYDLRNEKFDEIIFNPLDWHQLACVAEKTFLFWNEWCWHKGVTVSGVGFGILAEPWVGSVAEILAEPCSCGFKNGRVHSLWTVL